MFDDTRQFQNEFVSEPFHCSFKKQNFNTILHNVKAHQII